MAEGAGGKEVGRISIRVTPNTENFRRDLQRQLDEIEKDTKAKIRIEPDLDGFREKVDAATRNLKDAKVKVKTDFDSQGKMIHDLDAAVEDAGRKSKGAKVNVTPNINQSSFQKALRDVQAQAKLADVKLDVDFKDKNAEARLAELIGKLKAEAAASDIKLKIREETTGGGRGRGFFGGGRGGFGGGGRGFDFVPNIAGLGGVPSILLIVSALSLLAPALSLVAQAIVGLPALVAGVALPIGVFALGIGGFKKALDDSGILKDDQKLDKHGKPVGKDKQSLGSALKDIQQQVSDVFEKGFTPIFRQMGDAIPQLLRGLPFVAQGIVSLARAVTNAVVTPEFISNFDRFTNSVGTMLTRMGPGLGSFTTAMSNLITNVGDHLPGLGTVMSSWADRFSNWVTTISKPKQNWFGGDIPNSSTLDSSISNLKPILNSIIDFVGKLTDAGLKLAANKDMATNIKNVVDGLGNFVLQVLPGLEKFFAQVANLFGGIKPPEVSKDGKPLPPDPKKPPPVDFDRVNSPSDSHINGSWFGPSDGNLIPKFLRPDGFRDFLHNSLERPFTDHPTIVQQGGGGQQQQNQQQVQSPKVDTNGITQSIQGAAGPIAAAANAAFQGLIAAATVAVSQCVQAVQQLPGAVAQALSGLGPAGAAAGQALGTGMAGGIAASAPSAIAAATALAQGVENAAKGHLQINSPSKLFHEIGMGVGEGFHDGIKASFGDFNDIPWPMPGKNKVGVQKFPDKWAPWDMQDGAGGGGNFNPGIKIDTSTTTSTGADWMEGFTNGIRDGIPSLTKAAQGVADATTDAVKQSLGINSPSKVMQDIGQNTAQGFQNGLDGGAPGVIDSANKLAQQVTDAVNSHNIGGNLQGQVKDQLGAIKVEQDRLRAQEAGTTDKGQKKAIQGQIDQLNVSKDQLKASASQLGYSQKYGDTQGGNLKQQEEQLSVQQDQLRAQKDQTTDKATKAKLQQQIDQIQAQKDLLKLQDKGKDKAKNGKDLNDVLPDQLGKSLNSMVDIGKNFAMANISQFENDVGISGNGAIPTIANIGLNWATSTLGNMISSGVSGAMGGQGGNTHIHVNSIDEGLAAKQNIENRQALTHSAGR